MTVEKDILGKIRVEISEDDAKSLGINLKNYDPSDGAVRLVFKSLYHAAAERLGILADDSRLFIESYPDKSGGGIIVFTPLKKHDLKRITAYLKKSEFHIFDFSSGEELYRAAEEILKTCERPINCRLYSIGGIFRLIIFEKNPDAKYLHTAGELSHASSSSEDVKKYTYEHGKLLTGDYALNEILGIKAF